MPRERRRRLCRAFLRRVRMLLLAFAVLSAIAGGDAHGTQAAGEFDARQFGSKCDGVSDDSASLVSADSAGGSLVLPAGSTCVIGKSVTLANPLIFSAGSKVFVASGSSLTLRRDPVTPLQEIFAGPGMVLLPDQHTPVYAEWWGAAADNFTDSAPAFQKAVDALTGGGTIEVLTGNYKLGCAEADAVTLRGAKPVNIEGAGVNSTFFRPATNCAHSLFTVKGMGQSGNFRDFAIHGDQLFGGYSADIAYNGIDCERCGLMSDISRINIADIHDALNLSYFIGASVNSVEIQYFTGRAITLGGGPQNANGAEVASLGSFNDVNVFCYVPRFTGTLDKGSKVITGVSNFAGIVRGMFLFNPQIPGNPRTTVTAFDAAAGTITLSAEATGTAAGTTIAAENGGPNGATGIVIDSGADEMKFSRLVEAGCQRGLVVQNSAANGHRPEGLRFYAGGNINNNWDFDIGLFSANEIEMHGMAATGAENGPSILLESDDGHCAVEGLLFDAGIIAGAAQDGLLGHAGCNVIIENSVVVANGYSTLGTYHGIHIAAGSTGSWHIAGNQFGPNMWGNLNNTTERDAIAIDRGALARYSYANYFGGGAVRFEGRLFVAGNDFALCCAGAAIDDRATPSAGAQIVGNAGYPDLSHASTGGPDP
jgi:hypothetical protein